MLNGLSGELLRSLLAEMEPATVASLLEFLEPEESASLLRDRQATHVAPVLDFTAADVAADLLHLLPAKQQLETLREMTESGEVEDLLQ